MSPGRSRSESSLEMTSVAEGTDKVGDDTTAVMGAGAGTGSARERFFAAGRWGHSEAAVTVALFVILLLPLFPCFSLYCAFFKYLSIDFIHSKSHFLPLIVSNICSTILIRRNPR